VRGFLFFAHGRKEKKQKKRPGTAFRRRAGREHGSALAQGANSEILNHDLMYRHFRQILKLV